MNAGIFFTPEIVCDYQSQNVPSRTAMMNLQDFVTVGPSETVPGISAAPAHVSTWLQMVINLGTIDC